MERTKEELLTVLECLRIAKARVPEISIFGDDNWGMIDTQEYYVQHLLNHGVLPPLEEEDDEFAYECHCWLKGEENDFYEDCIAELE